MGRPWLVFLTPSSAISLARKPALGRRVAPRRPQTLAYWTRAKEAGRLAPSPSRVGWGAGAVAKSRG